MSVLDDLPKGSFSTVLFGLGVAIVAPTVIPALASGLRPLAKVLVKGGITLYDAAKEGVAEAGEQLSDLVAETRAEMEEEAKAETKEGATDQEEQDIETTGKARRRRARS